MDLKLLARVGAIAFVALAIVMTAVEVRDHPHIALADQPALSASAADPLAAELGHCQAIGAAGANDPGCLAAWTENRHRFLAPAGRATEPAGGAR